MRPSLSRQQPRPRAWRPGFEAAGGAAAVDHVLAELGEVPTGDVLARLVEARIVPIEPVGAPDDLDDLGARQRVGADLLQIAGGVQEVERVGARAQAFERRALQALRPAAMAVVILGRRRIAGVVDRLGSSSAAAIASAIRCLGSTVMSRRTP
ncbi:MAG: hypothetical protein WDM81_13805 [Rhizomicrobium sp.]